MVDLLVQGSHAAGLVEIGTRGKDDHVGSGLAMDVLIGHLTQQFGVGISARFVKDDKLAPAFHSRDKHQRAVAGTARELYRLIRLRHVPSPSGAATPSHLITHTGRGLLLSHEQ